MNILVLGSRVVADELAKDLCTAFLNARFTNEDRHRRRLAKVHAIEQKYSNGPAAVHSTAIDSATKEKIS
jgi:ribose 5-phosphate isomerase B